MIWSTSLPWKPTSVNLVASTFKNGACDNFAILLAISVLPQPVGPIYELKLKLKYK